MPHSRAPQRVLSPAVLASALLLAGAPLRSRAKDGPGSCSNDPSTGLPPCEQTAGTDQTPPDGAKGDGTGGPKGTPPPSVGSEDGEAVYYNGASPRGMTVGDFEAMVKAGRASDVESFLDPIVDATRGQADHWKPRSLRAWARFNQDDKGGALEDAEASLRTMPGDTDPQDRKMVQDIKDHIEMTGRAAQTDLRLKAPRFESKEMGARFERMAGGAFDGGMGKLMAGGSNRGPSQAGGGGGYDAVDAGGAGWHASGRGSGAYAPAAQGTLPLSQGLTASQVLVQSADKKLRLGDLSGAFLEATRAVQADGRNTGAWSARASVSNKLKNHDAAIADATEALKLEPRNVPALLERGYAQYNMGNLAAALEDVGSAIKIEPMNALAYLYRGMIFEKMTRYSEALSDYEAAARLDPTLRQFWEDAKARLLGGGKGKAGSSGAKARRRFFWTIPSGLALIILVLFIRRRLKDREQAEAAVDPAGPDSET